MGVDEPSSAAAAASRGPYAEDGLLCPVLRGEGAVLVTHLEAWGRNRIVTPVFNLLAVDFFFTL